MCLSCVSPLQSVMVTGAPLMLPIKIIHVLQSCAFVPLPSFPPFCEDPVPPWKLCFLLHFCQKLNKELVPIFCCFWPLEVPQVGSGPTARAGEAGVQHQQLLTRSSSLPSCAGRFRPCWDSLRACAASRGCCQGQSGKQGAGRRMQLTGNSFPGEHTWLLPPRGGVSA